MQIQRFSANPNPVKHLSPAPSPRVQRDSMTIRHDDVNDCLMGAGALALYGGMVLRAMNPQLGAMVAASSGLFIGAALLR
ncbi:hypothetical protein IV102_32440 [bacterium]|nr:hypothetical protein [bacterium]